MLQTQVSTLEQQVTELKQRNERLDVGLEQALQELQQQQHVVQQSTGGTGGAFEIPSRGILRGGGIWGGYLLGVTWGVLRVHVVYSMWCTACGVHACFYNET